MITALVSRIVILAFGNLYPAYASYKAVRTKDVKEYVKWMTYWIVFALFTFAETFTDVFLSFWFPFYYELKIGIVFWLLSPATKGSSFLYRNFVHPAFQKREAEIDEYLTSAKEKGYSAVMNIGSKSVNYATNIIVQTAIKGSGGIFEQLRKSYSLGDLSPKSQEFSDEPRPRHEHDQTDAGGSPRFLRRRIMHGESSASLDEDSLSALRQFSSASLSDVRGSVDDISSLTDSGLTRTSSVPSTRSRGRGGSRSVQGKKSTMNEDFYSPESGDESVPLPCEILDLQSEPKSIITVERSSIEIHSLVDELNDVARVTVQESSKDNDTSSKDNQSGVTSDTVGFTQESFETFYDVTNLPVEPTLEETASVTGFHSVPTVELVETPLVPEDRSGSLTSLVSTAESVISESGERRRKKRPAPPPPSKPREVIQLEEKDYETSETTRKGGLKLTEAIRREILKEEDPSELPHATGSKIISSV